MSDPGPAQLDLIRRYARTMREMHADAMKARGPRIGAAGARQRATAQAAKAMTGRTTTIGRDRGTPTLPTS
jgi:hypothetical protein